MKKILLITAALLIAFAFTFMLTENVSAQQLGCCLNTKEGDFCADRVSKDACEDGFFFTGKVCGNINQCQSVTCIPPEGECQANKPLFQCQFERGKFDARPLEEVEACQSGGCNIGNVICEVLQRNVCEQKARESGFPLEDVTFTPGLDEIEIRKQCGAAGRGTCDLGGGSCDYTTSDDCANRGGNFISGLFPSQVTACGVNNAETRKACGTLPGDENKIFWFNDQGSQEALIKDCGYPLSSCQEEVVDGAKTAICKSTACEFELKEKDSDGRQGMQNLLSGTSMCYNFHTDIEGRSTGLQHQILHCANGKIQVEGLGPDRNKRCIDEFAVKKEDKKAGLELGGNARVVDNLWQKCRECGQSDGGILGQLSSAGILGAASSGFVKGGKGVKAGELTTIVAGISFLSGGQNRIGDVFQIIPIAVPPGPWINSQLIGSACGGKKFLKDIGFVDDLADKFGFCKYQQDFLPWGGFGSAIPKVAPGNSKQCFSCGGGGDDLWNVCTPNECNALGDCQEDRAFTFDTAFRTFATTALVVSTYKTQECFVREGLLGATLTLPVEFFGNPEKFQSTFGRVVKCWEEFGKRQGEFYDKSIGEVLNRFGSPHKKPVLAGEFETYADTVKGDSKKIEELQKEGVELVRIRGELSGEELEAAAKEIRSKKNVDDILRVLQKYKVEDGRILNALKGAAFTPTETPTNETTETPANLQEAITQANNLINDARNKVNDNNLNLLKGEAQSAEVSITPLEDAERNVNSEIGKLQAAVDNQKLDEITSVLSSLKGAVTGLKVEVNTLLDNKDIKKVEWKIISPKGRINAGEITIDIKVSSLVGKLIAGREFEYWVYVTEKFVLGEVDPSDPDQVDWHLRARKERNIDDPLPTFDGNGNARIFRENVPIKQTATGNERKALIVIVKASPQDIQVEILEVIGGVEEESKEGPEKPSGKPGSGSRYKSYLEECDVNGVKGICMFKSTCEKNPGMIAVEDYCLADDREEVQCCIQKSGISGTGEFTVKITKPIEGAQVLSEDGKIRYQILISNGNPKFKKQWFKDGKPSTSTFKEFSDRDSGGRLSLDGGEHTIRVKITDANGRTAEDTITFTVKVPGIKTGPCKLRGGGIRFINPSDDINGQVGFSKEMSFDGKIRAVFIPAGECKNLKIRVYQDGRANGVGKNIWNAVFINFLGGTFSNMPKIATLDVTFDGKFVYADYPNPSQNVIMGSDQLNRYLWFYVYQGNDELCEAGIDFCGSRLTVSDLSQDEIWENALEGSVSDIITGSAVRTLGIGRAIRGIFSRGVENVGAQVTTNDPGPGGGAEQKADDPGQDEASIGGVIKRKGPVTEKTEKVNRNWYTVSKAIVLGYAVLQGKGPEAGYSCSAETSLIGKGTSLCKTCESEDGFRICTKERCEILGQCKAIAKPEGDGFNCVEAACNEPEGQRQTNVDRIEADFLLAGNVVKHVEGAGSVNAGLLSWNVTEIKLKIFTGVGANCRFSTEPGTAWENAIEFEGAGLFPREQEVTLSAGGAERQHAIFVKCQNVCGIENPAENDRSFLKYEKGKLPDFLPPEITHMDPFNVFVPEKPEIVTTQIHLSENGVCFFSRNLTVTEIQEMQSMDCAQNQRCLLSEKNACGICKVDTDVSKGDLLDFSQFEQIPVANAASLVETAREHGIEQTRMSRFVFRCQDLNGNQGEINPYILATVMDYDLTIIDPKEGFSTFDREVPLKVETAHSALCKFSLDSEKSFTDMQDITGEFGLEHETVIANLTVGQHTVFVACEDFALQQKKDSRDFSINLDNQPPIIIRAFRDFTGTGAEVLKIVTDEISSCRYSLTDPGFDFEEGIEMPFDESIEHIAEWGFSVYYIKCRDRFDNEGSQTVKPISG